MDARDTEIAISLWKEKAAQFGSPPPIGAVSPVDPTVDPFRFLIVADLYTRPARDALVFLDYGVGLARLFGLPKRPPMWRPMIECLPSRYRSLFLDGCKEAISKAAPVRFSGEMAVAGGSEFYRACFMPLKMKVDRMQALYGSFSFRLYTAAELAERSQLAAAEDSPLFPAPPMSAADKLVGSKA